MSVGHEVLAWRLASFHIHDELVLRQELVCHLHGRVHIASCVVAQVDYEVGESLLRQLSQGDEQFGIRSLAETLNLDVARVVVEHIGGGNALLRDVAASHGEVFHSLLSVAHHSYLHLSVLRTLQSSHSLVLSDYLAHEGLAVYAHNLVAGKQSRTLCRTVLHHILHMNSILAYCELNAHTRERAFQLVGLRLRVLGAYIGRMRIEVGQYLRYCHVYKRVDVHLVNILVVDDVQEIRQAVGA